MHELVTVTYDLTVTRPDGSIRTERSGRAESFVKQFVEHLRASMTGRDLTNTTTTGGNDDGIEAPPSATDVFMEADATSGTKTHGTVIGSGTTAVSVTDFKLDSKLTGSIEYSACDVQQVTTADPNASMNIQRDFTNKSSSSITVEEIGLVGRTRSNSGASENFLILRDRVASTTAAVNETVSVEYTITIEA